MNPLCRLYPIQHYLSVSSLSAAYTEEARKPHDRYDLALSCRQVQHPHRGLLLCSYVPDWWPLSYKLYEIQAFLGRSMRSTVSLRCIAFRCIAIRCVRSPMHGSRGCCLYLKPLCGPVYVGWMRINGGGYRLMHPSERLYAFCVTMDILGWTRSPGCAMYGCRPSNITRKCGTWRAPSSENRTRISTIQKYK